MTRPARWTGLAGGLLLAAGAVLAGTGSGAAPTTQAAALWGTSGWFRLGLLAYLVGLVLLGAAWWSVGRALRGPAPPGLRWVVVTGLLWTAPLLVAPPLGSRDLYAYACQGAIWLDGHDPYVVSAAAGGCPWLAAVPPVWQETGSPYGAVALLGFAAAVALARALVDDTAVQLLVAVAGLRLLAVAGVALVASGLPRLARVCGVSPASAAWLALISPLVAVHAVSGGHNDAWVAGLIVVALAVSVGGPASPAAASPVGPSAAGAKAAGTGARLAAAGVAGVAVAAAVAVKVTAVAAVPFVLLLAARRGRAPAVVAGLAAGAGFAILSWLTGGGLGWVAALADTGSLAQWSSPPTGVGMAIGYLIWALGAPDSFEAVVTIARGVGVGILLVVSVGLLWRAWRLRHDPAAVLRRAGVVLAAVVVFGPVFYPWYALVPVAVLAAAAPAGRARRWLAAVTLGVTALTLPSGLGVPVLTRLPGAVLMAGTVGWLSWWWLRHRAPTAPAVVAERVAAAGPAPPVAARPDQPPEPQPPAP